MVPIEIGTNAWRRCIQEVRKNETPAIDFGSKLSKVSKLLHSLVDRIKSLNSLLNERISSRIESNCLDLERAFGSSYSI